MDMIDKVLIALLAAAYVSIVGLLLYEHTTLENEIKADRELIQSLYYTLGQQEIACDTAIEAAQVSCVD